MPRYTTQAQCKRLAALYPIQPMGLAAHRAVRIGGIQASLFTRGVIYTDQSVIFMNAPSIHATPEHQHMPPHTGGAVSAGLSTAARSSVSTSASGRREQKKQNRRAALLDAALDIFVDQGYAAARMDDVAQRAGVSKGTLFLYFESKEALFKSLVHDKLTSLFAEGAIEVSRYTGSTGEMLLELMLTWWQRYGSTKSSGISKLIMSEASHFPELARFYQEEVMEPGRRLMGSVIERGIARGEFRSVDVASAVHSIAAPLLFLVMWKHAMAPCAPAHVQIDPESFIRQHVELLLQGLKT